MARQTTLARPVKVSGAGLHTARAGTVALYPVPADHGRRIGTRAGEPRPVSWEHWVPSRMSTSIDLGEGRRIRTIEHMMAALSAHGIDNVRIEIDGPEIPIFDGSASRWCRCLREAGVETLAASRRAIRIKQSVQVERDGGFLRAEPGPRFEVDVTHDVLSAFPVMRWRGTVDPTSFDRELARARSFGNLHRRLGLEPKTSPRPVTNPPIAPNEIDVNIGVMEKPWADIAARTAEEGPLLRGWRPWRATLIAGGLVLPWPRFPDEPVRHVTLDMIGDLALAGAPLLGRIVAHNPSHAKTFALVAALMTTPEAWDLVSLEDSGTGVAA